MSWASWSDFAAMGGYALYVWGSYGVTAGLIIVEIILLGSRRRAALAGCQIIKSDSLLKAKPPEDLG